MEDVLPSMSAPSLHSHVEPNAEPPVPSSVSFPGATNIDAATFHNLTNGNGTNGSNIRPHPDSLDDHGLAPTRRARKLSDTDSASLNHTTGFVSPPLVPAAATPPTPAHPPVSSSAVPQTLTTAQHCFMQSTIRTLKRMKDAVPFLHPVDPIALNIPHYPAIISTKSSSQPKASGSGSKAYNGSDSSKKKGKNEVPDVEEVLSVDQRKELSETIQTLEGQKLERVIQIIHEGMPEIRDVRGMRSIKRMMFVLTRIRLLCTADARPVLSACCKSKAMMY